MAERADLVDQVMSWEAEAITAKDSLMEVELSGGKDITNAVDVALAIFKSLDVFAMLLKKNHDIGFDAGVEAIFYNIWAHYRDLDYAFLGRELTDLIREWIEEERLNAHDVALPFVPFNPSTRNVVKIEISSAKNSEHPSVVEVDELTVAFDPSIAPEVPVTKPSSSVVAVQPLINLE